MPDLKTELGKVSNSYKVGATDPKTGKTAAVTAESSAVVPDKKRNVVKPVNVRRLAELVGIKEAAKLLHYSETGVTGAINERDEITTTTEKLATYIVKEMEGRRDRTFIVKVPSEKAEAYQAFCTAFGISHTSLDDL